MRSISVSATSSRRAAAVVGALLALILAVGEAGAKVFFSRQEALALAFPDAERVEGEVFVLDDQQAARVQELSRSMPPPIEAPVAVAPVEGIEPVAGKLPLSREVADIIAFKKMLLEREHLVARCLTEKMLSYGSGRLLEPGDRGEVDRITTDLAEKGNGLRDLVHLVVQSDLFLNK